MIRTLLRSVLCFCAAVILLGLGVCALEFGCRLYALASSFNSKPEVVLPDELTVPSPTSWREVRPLLSVENQLPDGVRQHIRTNELGIRGPSFAIPKPAETLRVLCLGGSGIFGCDVAEQETLPACLQQILAPYSHRPIEVINAGCPEAGPLAHVLRYRSKLAALQPDIVILCVGLDDLIHDVDVRGALRLDERRQPAFAAHPGSLKTGGNAADEVCKDFLCASWAKDWFWTTIGGRSLPPAVLTPQEGGYGRRELGPIASLAQMVTANGGRLLISTTPSAWGFEQARSAAVHQRPSFADDIRRVLVDLQLSDRVTVHDVLPELCQQSDPKLLFSIRRGCLTGPGNQQYASSLARFLLQNAPELTQRVPGIPRSNMGPNTHTVTGAADVIPAGSRRTF